MAKKVVRPRRHGRKPRAIALDDAGVFKRHTDAIVAFDREFRAHLPADLASGQGNVMSNGSYVQVDGDRYHEKDYPIADGRYRVAGSEWIHTFEGGGYVESVRAEPPDFGGKGVTSVNPA